MNKTIHYFWFGGNKKSQTILKCIESWKKYFPDFEIKEWNEDNFDVNCNAYVREAYAAKKYAFVSDFARFFVLEKYGGLYFDTDVEVIKPFYDLLELDSFCGFETDYSIGPGLVLWFKDSGSVLLQELIDQYNTLHFIKADNTYDTATVCTYFTEKVKEKYTLKLDNSKQKCGELTVFPREYFCPLDNNTGVMKKTQNTYTIHWYAKSWVPKRLVIRSKITRVFHRYFGVDCFKGLKRLWKRKG